MPVISCFLVPLQQGGNSQMKDPIISFRLFRSTVSADAQSTCWRVIGTSSFANTGQQAIPSAPCILSLMLCLVMQKPALCFSSIVNLPGESTLRREFLRLQQENKNRSDPHRQQQQLKDQEKYKKQLLTERQKRIDQQKEQRRRLEDVGTGLYCCSISHHE